MSTAHQAPSTSMIAYLLLTIEIEVRFTKTLDMESKAVEEYFSDIFKNEENVSAGVAAIRTLMEVIKHDNSFTVQQLHETLKSAIEVMKNMEYTVTAISSGSELFLRFITLAKLDTSSFVECKEIMLNRGMIFIKRLNEARNKITNFAKPFIRDGTNILTHSRSRVVLQTLQQAAKDNKKFHVYITSSAPDNSGAKFKKELEAEGISCTLILDLAVGYIMEKIDFILVGAEGVVANGGIVNKIGTFTIAICAKTMKKPVYVLTESFKFTKMFPLGQYDLPAASKYTKSMREGNLDHQHPLVDYTPPQFLTLLFTDLGILTPAAVSDELINLYL